MRKPVVVAVAKYGLGLGLLAWLVWRYWSPADGSPGLAAALERPVNVTALLLAGALCSAAVLLTFVRWFVLVRALDLPFTLGNAIRLGFAGYSLSTLVPGATLGGDVVKAAFLARQQDRRTAAVATVLIDRLVGLCALFWLVALLGGVFWAGGWMRELADGPAAVLELQSIITGAAVLAGGSLLFWLLLGFLPARRAEIFAGRLRRIPKAGGPLAEMWRAVWMYRCRGRSVGLALLLALVGHVGFVLTFYFAARTLSAPGAIPSLGAHFLIVPVGMIIQAGFPAPGGIGGAELAFAALYGRVGSPAANGLLAALAQRVVTWVLALAGLVVYLRMGPAASPAREPGRAEDDDGGPAVIARAG